MGRAMELVAGFATNPSSTLTTVTPSNGQSFTIRGTDTTKPTWLLSTFAFCATAGAMRFTSPRLHDQVQGYRWQVPAASVQPKYAGPINQAWSNRLYAQDNITAQISGGGSELDCLGMLVAYSDLAGVQGRFIDPATLKTAGVNGLTQEVTVTGGTDGNWDGGVAINSTFDTLIANTDYAILGGIVNTRGLGVGISGVDLGNLRTGFPAEPTLQHLTNNWFVELSNAFNFPCIPVINSANKAAVIIDVMTNGAGGTYIIDLNLVQLAPNSVPQNVPAGASAQPS